MTQVLLFASIDKGVILSDTVPFIHDLGIVGIHTPHTLVLQKPATAGGLPRVARKAMRDYAGVDMSDDKVVLATGLMPGDEGVAGSVTHMTFLRQAIAKKADPPVVDEAPESTEEGDVSS